MGTYLGFIEYGVVASRFPPQNEAPPTNPETKTSHGARHNRNRRSYGWLQSKTFKHLYTEGRTRQSAEMYVFGFIIAFLTMDLKHLAYVKRFVRLGRLFTAPCWYFRRKIKKTKGASPTTSAPIPSCCHATFDTRLEVSPRLAKTIQQDISQSRGGGPESTL